VIRAALLGIVLVATSALADDIIKGAIVKVEHEEIYVNIGAKQGLADGAALRIKRTVNLKHPVSRAPIVDWIPIGSATVTESGSGLSRAVIGPLIDRVKIGDLVEALVTDATTAPVETPKPRPRIDEPPAVPVDPQVAAVLAVFAQQSGLSLDARIAAWEKYLSTAKASPFAAAIQQDVEQLQALRDQMKSNDPAAAEVFEQLDHDAPGAAVAGEDIPLVFVLDAPERVASAYLHYRTRGSRTFTRTLLVRENEIYLRGAIPAAAVRAPGVDYFVEVSTPNGAAGLAFRTPGDPLAVTVKPPPITDRFAERRGRTTLTLSMEYLDFRTFDRREGDRTDRMYDARLDVGYRLESMIRRVGVGYGSIGGQGGFRNIPFDPAGSPLPESGYHYGYADVEVGVPRYIVGGKLIAGVGKDGLGMGVEGRGRIGAWDGTNLTLTGRKIPEVGYDTHVRLGTRPADDLLLGLSVGATDMPNEGHLAAKLVTEFQWIGNEHVTVLVRGSWQGRSSIHGGIGGGAALGVTW
jgi:hypothetical protein